MKFSQKTLSFITTGTAIILLIGLLSFNKKINDPVIDKIADQLNKWLSDYNPEKVYLQTDKPFYSAGDDMWFKAYITISNKHQLSALSGSVNVELIDEQDSVKQWVKLPVNAGTAWGDFKLSDTLHEGNYRLRAYTNWMRNAGPDYYFDKAITIGNVATNIVFTQTSYTYATVNNQQKVTATINYTDINGAPYAGKPVNYRVQFNNKSAAKGKGVTDDKGNIAIDLIKPASASSNKGNIITDIKIAEKNTVTKTITVNATSGKVDLQFFPESGNLVNGIRSKIAFKAIGTNGLGVNIKGEIIDNENNKAGEFATRHLGMGLFALIPESGKTYKAKITYADGSENTVNLPTALNSGYVLSINNTDADNIGVRVTASNDISGQVYIVAQSGGQLCYVANNKAPGNSFSTTIPKSRFPSGIVQFTLFSSNGDPLNERVAFIQHSDDRLKLNITPSKAASAIREKVKIDLDVQNSGGKPAIGSFSAAVIDESKVQSDESAETTILSHILLTSDLRGYIEQPNYYFKTINETTQADLDVLMLTQGYRRFEWKPLLTGTLTPPAYRPEKLIQISGTVKTPGGKPVPNAKITLFTPSKNFFLLDSVTDSEGRFAFKNLVLKDSVRFILQARTAKNGKNVEIILDDNGRNDVRVKNEYLSAINFSTDEKFGSYLKANKKLFDEELKYGLGNHSIVLKEVTIADKQKVLLENSTNMNGPGNADQVITGDAFDRMGCSTIDICLEQLIHGVIFREGKAYSTRSQNTPMLILLDGLQWDDLIGLSASDIASIEVLKNISYTALYGPRGNGGVLVITTRRGNEQSNTARVYAPGLITYSPKGYYVARQFYSPQYDDPKTNQAIADLRTTIYWKPDIITDQSGHASFEYFNAGSPGTYRVIIEGIDSDGNLGHEAYLYKVE